MIRSVFERLSLKDKRFETHDPIKDDTVYNLFNAINLHADLSQKENNDSLDKRPMLKAFLKHCCKERTYFFSVKKCGSPSCTTCLPIRLSSDIFERLHHIPDLLPSTTNEGHYEVFNTLYVTATTEEHMLSKKTSARQGHGIPFQPHKQHASNTNLRIVCLL